MPHTDDLYSADDVDPAPDTESLSDQLSPSDGYFNGRSPGLPNQMVSDPSVEQENAAEVKALEAKLEAEANYKYPSSMVQALEHPSQESSSASNQRPNIASSSQNLPTETAQSSRQVARSPPPSSSLVYTPVSSFRASESAFPAHQSTQDDFISDQSHYFTPSDAPPTYAAAIASPTESTSPRSPLVPTPNDYQTFPSSNTEPDRNPESMGRPEEYTASNETESLLPKRTKPHRKSLRSIIRKILLVLLALALISGFITSLTSKKSSTGQPPSNNKPDKPDKEVPGTSPGDKDPSFNPPLTESPYCVAATHRLFDGKPVIYEIPVNAGRELGLVHSLSDDDYTGQFPISTSGQIRLRHISREKTDGKGFITMDIRTSDPSLKPDITMNSDVSTLKIITPKYGNFNDHRLHCISLEITVWLPETTALESMLIFSSTLSLRVYDDLMVNIKEHIALETISGSIRGPSIDRADNSFGTFQSPLTVGEDPGTISDNETEYYRSRLEKFEQRLAHRKSHFQDQDDKYEVPSDWSTGQLTCPTVYIATISGSVRGSFDLYDELTISTTSGSIDVAVTPHEARDSDHIAAVTSLDTKSGSIKAYFPVHRKSSLSDKLSIPYREYNTKVEAASGSIRGSFIIGSEATFQSHSGSITVDALPFFGCLSRQVFVTDAASNAIHMTVLPPYNFSRSDFESTSILQHEPGYLPIGDDDPYLRLPSHGDGPSPYIPQSSALRNLQGTFQSTSGSATLYLPSSFEGAIHGSSMSGSLDVDGYGVRIDSRKDVNWAYKGIRAHKGSDYESASLVDVSTIGGSARVHVYSPREDPL